MENQLEGKVEVEDNNNNRECSFIDKVLKFTLKVRSYITNTQPDWYVECNL